MEWRKPLESLDQLILNQFEKVAEAAHRKYGWDKYDLMGASDLVLGLGTSAGGVYLLLAGTWTQDIPAKTIAYAVGLLSLPFGFWSYHLIAQNAKNQRMAEQRNMEEGKVFYPPILPERPLLGSIGLAIGTAGTTIGIVYDRLGYTDLRLGTAVEISFTLAVMSGLCGWYFRDTTTRPPKKKRYPLQSLVEKIKVRLTPKPVAEETAVPMRANYSTIDTIANTNYQP